jgi:hypothetical protein
MLDLELGRTKFQTGVMWFKNCTNENTLRVKPNSCNFHKSKKNTDKIVEPLSQDV